MFLIKQTYSAKDSPMISRYKSILYFITLRLLWSYMYCNENVYYYIIEIFLLL